MVTRLEVLTQIHEVQGGTIHQYNALYGIDFYSLSLCEFVYKVEEIIRDTDAGRKWRKAHKWSEALRLFSDIGV